MRLRLAPTSLCTHAPSLFRAAAGPARHSRLPAPGLRAAVDAGCRIARAGAIVMANHIGIGTCQRPMPLSTMPVQLQRGLFRRDSRPQAQHHTPTPHTHTCTQMEMRPERHTGNSESSSAIAVDSHPTTQLTALRSFPFTVFLSSVYRSILGWPAASPLVPSS